MAKQVAPAILSTRDSTGVMRARDVRLKLAGRVDPELMQVLCTLAEINHGNVLHLASLASMVDQMTNIMQQFTDVAHNMKKRTDEMARAMGEEVEGAPTDGTDSKTSH